jgi:PASTA domain
MAGQLTYYDILGVTAGASADDVQRGYEARMAVLAPGMIAGAPSKVVATVDRARAALELARRTLTDPVGRRIYDVDSGVLRVGGGLSRPQPVPSTGNWTWDGNVRGADLDAPAEFLGMFADWLALRPARARRVTVPDAQGLFVGPARRLMTLSGLHAAAVQLTRDPMPVEGLVIDQSVPAGARVRRMSPIELQVWHPPRQRQR